MPLLEDITPEVVLERILGRMDTQLQTREGSYAYDQAAPISFEIWRVLMTLDELIDAFYVNENSGKYLDAHAKLFALSRREGARAAAKMIYTGRNGTVIPAGTLFYAGGAAQFRSTSEAVIQDGSAQGWLLADQAGAQGNVPAGAIDQMARTIPGLEKFENQEAQGGADPEPDVDLFARLDEKRKRPPTSGNPSHYREWALSVDGVGAVRVTPLWKGPGTVKVLIAGFDRRPVDQAIVERCARYIESQRPVGADVTVASAVAVEVVVAARVVLTPGATLAAVEGAFAELLRGYFADAAFEEFTVYANRVGALRERLKDIMPAHLDWQVVFPMGVTVAVGTSLGVRLSQSTLPGRSRTLPGLYLPCGAALGGRMSVTTLPMRAEGGGQEDGL